MKTFIPFLIYVLISFPLLFSQTPDVSINGTFLNPERSDAKAVSENGKFWCNYDIGKVTDEMRELKNFRFYNEEGLLFSLSEFPGSDVEISNSGIAVFYDHSEHFKNKLTLHFYSGDGRYLHSFSFTGATLFKFSKRGDRFGIRTTENISVINFTECVIENYPKGYKFNFSEDNTFIAIASEKKVLVFKNSELLYELQTNLILPRTVELSNENDLLMVADKYNLYAYSLSSGAFKWKDILDVKTLFKDIQITSNKIFAGLHKKENNLSKGFLKIYDLSGNVEQVKEGASKKYKSFQHVQHSVKSRFNYETIPWMFEPFDSMRTIWNHYEQHMGDGGSNWSYLHQGLDLITPIGEPVYAVKGGIVKCVLTTGGDVYWRIAVSDSQTAGISDGWLYAHLIENTIQFEEGDTVNVHDYLGNIIDWSGTWGHIHFVEIRDSGIVWFYFDNEWGINFNPLLALDPLPDFISPSIENVFADSKFAFCKNETSTYLEADSLSGEIDIIIKVVDYAGDSEWQQPAFETYYWIKNLENNLIVVPRRLGHRLNHSYAMYESGYYEPFATVMYKRDVLLPSPMWMNPVRGFYHVLTNSDGDSLINLSEKNLSLNTENFLDGSYRIYAEVFDEAGNSYTDSMDVIFDNGIVPVELISFTAFASDNFTSLNWTTASELNNYGFEIERSNDKKEWRLIGFREGNGTTTEASNYSFADDLFGNNSYKLYYRLKQIDFNGSFEYSDIIEVDLAPSSFSLSPNYPNPFNPITKIKYSIPNVETHRNASLQVVLKVYDVLGREVATLVNEEKQPGVYEVEFQSSVGGKQLASGIYYYQLKAGNFVETKKMILIK